MGAIILCPPLVRLDILWTPPLHTASYDDERGRSQQPTKLDEAGSLPCASYSTIHILSLPCIVLKPHFQRSLPTRTQYYDCLQRGGK